MTKATERYWRILTKQRGRKHGQLEPRPRIRPKYKGGSRTEERKVPTSFNLTPLLKVSLHYLFRLSAHPSLLYPSNIKCPVLPRERPNTTHVVPIITELVSRETVFRRVWKCSRGVGQHVQIFAFPAIWTASSGEEKTTVLDACRIGTRETCVAFDVASCLRFRFTAGEE